MEDDAANRAPLRCLAFEQLVRPTRSHARSPARSLILCLVRRLQRMSENDATCPKLIPFYDRAERAVWAARLRNPFLLARAIPNAAGFIELYPWPLHVYRDLTDTKAAKLATGLVSIHLQQDEHLSRREANRRNYSIGDQVANKARHSLGNGLRRKSITSPDVSTHLRPS
jgi:hypothetical protein